VFRVGSLQPDKVRTLGARHLRNPIPIAHAVSVAGTILDAGLKFDINNKPERHVDLVGWPLPKQEQKLVALKLASAARLFPYA